MTTNIAQADLFSTENFNLFADFRTRFEADWNSQKSDTTEREDRSRMRIRARLGFNYQANDLTTFTARLRTGSDDSHVSPHITIINFEGNDTGDTDINFDKWFLKLKKQNTWAWIGRNSLPFWKQNELFWDDDVTPAGVGVGYKANLENNQTVAINGGYFTLPVGMQSFNGHIAMGQIVFSGQFGNNKFMAAGGMLAFDAKTDDSDTSVLLTGNGTRDYHIWIASLQGQFKMGNYPLKLGLDLMHNAKDYAENDINAYTVKNRDEINAYVISAVLGKLKVPENWLVGYYYAQIEALSVNASYAQDDWVRWGSAIETRGSDMKGHELRAVYMPIKNLTIMARLYVTKAITTAEDGKRFRLDFNYKF